MPVTLTDDKLHGSIVDDTTTTRGELTDDEMVVINSLKLQNKIKEVSKSVSEDGFDAEEASDETVEKLLTLVMELRTNFGILGMDDKVEDCTKTLKRLTLIRGKGHAKTWATRVCIQDLYVFTMTDVAEQL